MTTPINPRWQPDRLRQNIEAADALTIEAPHAVPNGIAVVFQITPRE